MGLQIETKPYYFKNQLKLLAIVKTKQDEIDFENWERKTYLMNLNGEKVLDIYEHNKNTMDDKRLQCINFINCYDHFFVIEAISEQCGKQKVCYKAYSYHGKLLQAEPRNWNKETDFFKIEKRLQSRCIKAEQEKTTNF